MPLSLTKGKAYLQPTSDDPNPHQNPTPAERKKKRRADGYDRTSMADQEGVERGLGFGPDPSDLLLDGDLPLDLSVEAVRHYGAHDPGMWTF